MLVYTSAPLTAPLTFAGPLRAEVYGSADTPDADWVVKLIDVRPDGFAQNLAVGILSSSFREGDLNNALLSPGRVVQFGSRACGGRFGSESPAASGNCREPLPSVRP